MKHSRRTRAFHAAAFIIAWCCADVTSVHAQGIELDTRLGLGGGWTSAETVGYNVGVAADVLLSVPFNSWNNGLLAAAVGYHTGGPHADICRIAKDGGCVPSFPGIGYISVLAGLDEGGDDRYAAGVAYSSEAGIGMQARYDRRWGRRLGTLFGLNAMAFHSFDGEPIFLVSAGVGLIVR